jgi:hypothetical protein
MTATLRSGPPICDISLMFFDGQSNMLKSTEVMTNPGGSTSLPLTPRDIKGLLGKGRPMVYGEVQLMNDSDPSCQIINSLEIVDPNGRTETLTPFAFGGGRAVGGPTS